MGRHYSCTSPASTGGTYKPRRALPDGHRTNQLAGLPSADGEFESAPQLVWIAVRQAFSRPCYDRCMETAEEILQVVRIRLEAEPEVLAAWLFGSRARGEARPDSDVDVAVLLRSDPPATLEGLHLGLESDLEQACRLPVDLVIVNRAPPDLVHRILRDGVLLLERDRSARVRFEVRSRNEYFDVLPFLRRYRRMVA